MKKFLVLVLGIGISFALYQYLNSGKNTVQKTGVTKQKERKLLAYTFENLRNTAFDDGGITIGRQVEEAETTQSRMFYFHTPAIPGGKPVLKVSGLMNMPKKQGTYPVIVMFRGFVPEDIYEPGVGTQRAAQVYANQGYITLAPDFLGFAESDKPSGDSLEARFQTYSTALSLFASVKSLNSALDAHYSGTIQADVSKIGVWGHSNGGHIALAALAISGSPYPTVLWAPVSKSFPYSILYYTDEAEDQGKALRKVLASFEQEYDAQLFSPTHYYQWIKAPLFIQQGTGDREVPVYWSDDLVQELKNNEAEVAYETYPGADHNLVPSWSRAVEESVSFFNGLIKGHG